MRPGQAGPQLHAWQQIVVFPHGARTVAPGVLGDKAILIAVLTLASHAAVKRALAKHIGAAITQSAAPFQTANMGHTDFPHQGQAVGTHDLIKGMYGSQLSLGDFLTLIAIEPGLVGNLVGTR